MLISSMTSGMVTRVARYCWPRWNVPRLLENGFFVAGLLAWAAIAQPFLLPLLHEPHTITDVRVALGLVAHIAYLSAFLASTTRLEKLSPRARVTLLLIQSASSLELIQSSFRCHGRRSRFCRIGSKRGACLVSSGARRADECDSPFRRR